MITTLLAALVIGPNLQAPLAAPAETPEEARARARREMERDLQAWARLEGASLVVDVGADVSPTPAAKIPRGEFGMRVLAGQLNRRWEQAEGRQYFTRLPDIGVAGARRVQYETLSLLLDLMGRYGPQLTGAGLSTRDLDPATLGRLVELAQRMTHVGTTERLLTEAPRTATVRLFLRPAVTVDRPGDPPFTMIEPRMPDDVVKPADPVGELDWPKLQPAPDGNLDFGEGRLMTVWEATRFAHPTFQERYFVDGRLVDDLVFLSGKFTRESFTEAMRRILTTTPFSARDPRADPHGRLMDEMLERFYDLLKGTVDTQDRWGDVTPDEARRGIGQKLSDLKERMPRLYNALTTPPRNLAPDSPARVTLALELEISFGTRTQIGETEGPDGRMIPVRMPDRLRLPIGR